MAGHSPTGRDRRDYSAMDAPIRRWPEPAERECHRARQICARSQPPRWTCRIGTSPREPRRTRPRGGRSIRNARTDPRQTRDSSGAKESRCRRRSRRRALPPSDRGSRAGPVRRYPREHEGSARDAQGKRPQFPSSGSLRALGPDLITAVGRKYRVFAIAGRAPLRPAKTKSKAEHVSPVAPPLRGQRGRASRRHDAAGTRPGGVLEIRAKGGRGTTSLDARRMRDAGLGAAARREGGFGQGPAAAHGGV